MDTLEYLRSIYGQSLLTNQNEALGIADRSSDDKSNEKIQSLARICVRIHSISDAIIRTIENNQASILEATELLAQWMKEGDVIRVIGAGRALMASTLSANRLAHGGAQVSLMGSAIPMPNSERGGGVIAASASGKTKPVIEAMEVAKENNPEIIIIGIADNCAETFQDYCDVFIGIHKPVLKVSNPLSALADQEELIITELLDAITVLAGELNGFDDEAWRRGHEDIGPTGPYAPKLK